jgi:uncharacterized protein (TIGR03435 family)
LTAVALSVCDGWAQGPERPHFEVASLKPNPQCKNNAHVFSPILIEWSCITLERLIHNAYVTFADGKKLNPNDTEIVGMPNWASSDTYSLSAKAEGATVLPFMAGPMLQVLLEDRFKLKIRRATKEERVYSLRPLKDGPKLERTKEGSCLEGDLGPSSSFEVRSGLPDKAPCGNISVRETGPNLIMEGHGTTGLIFSQALSHFVNSPVIDKIGVAGRFDIHLEFMRTEASSADSNSPSIFEAVEQQLGLKLVSDRAPVEYLTVEHVEKLSVSEY